MPGVWLRWKCEGPGSGGDRDGNAALVRDFVDTFTDLTPSTRPTKVIDHTDDYPNLEMVVTAADGAESTVWSSSNTRDRTPWNVDHERELFVSNNPDSSAAYARLREAVLGDRCDPG